MSRICELCADNLHRLGRGREIAKLPSRKGLAYWWHRIYQLHLPTLEADGGRT